jgi:hypothetical protein
MISFAGRTPPWPPFRINLTPWRSPNPLIAAPLASMIDRTFAPAHFKTSCSILSLDGIPPVSFVLGKFKSQLGVSHHQRHRGL